MSWYEVGFWQGDFGRTVADIVSNTDGVIVHGATVPTYAAGIHFLAQWDSGDDDSILRQWDEIPTYAGDAGPYYFDGYAIVVNTGLGTVALYREVGLDDWDTATCLACGEAADYCLGGHDSQMFHNDLRTGYEIADDEYNAVYLRLEIETADM